MQQTPEHVIIHTNLAMPLLLKGETESESSSISYLM